MGFPQLIQGYKQTTDTRLQGTHHHSNSGLNYLLVNRCYPELAKYGFSPANSGVQTNFYCYYHGALTFKIE